MLSGFGVNQDDKKQEITSPDSARRQNRINHSEDDDPLTVL